MTYDMTHDIRGKVIGRRDVIGVHHNQKRKKKKKKKKREERREKREERREKREERREEGEEEERREERRRIEEGLRVQLSPHTHYDFSCKLWRLRVKKLAFVFIHSINIR